MYYKENIFISDINTKLIFNNLKKTIDLGYKLIPIVRNTIVIEKELLIDNTFNVFSKFNKIYSNKEFYELKQEFINIEFEKSSPLIFKYEDKYIDISIYHILNFIKDTKYILRNLESKKELIIQDLRLTFFKKNF